MLFWATFSSTLADGKRNLPTLTINYSHRLGMNVCHKLRSAFFFFFFRFIFLSCCALFILDIGWIELGCITRSFGHIVSGHAGTIVPMYRRSGRFAGIALLLGTAWLGAHCNRYC